MIRGRMQRTLRSLTKNLQYCHPYFAALFPILALYAHNIREIEFSVVARSIVISLAATTLLLILLQLLYRNFGKAALACTFVLILFFSYGHIYTTLKEVSLFNVLVGRHRILVPIWAIIFAAGMWRISRAQQGNAILHRTLCVIMIVAMISPVYQIGNFLVHTSILARAEAHRSPEQIGSTADLPPEMNLPDVYYIILDGYTRQDTLREFYGFDNQEFIDHLEELGFFVPSCSQSNYAQTLLSLPSSLNFDYLQGLMKKFKPGNEDFYELWVLLKHSASQKLFESMGYHTVAFETGFYWSQLDDADFYLRRSTSELQKWQYLGGLNNYEVMLIKSTMGLIVTDGFVALPKALKPNLDSPDQKHRERVLFVLDELEGLPAYPSPKFVFAHIVSPHEPFIFDAQGQMPEKIEGENPEAQEKRRYTDQITYINARMEKILESIIASSTQPPVIVVQADHGTDIGSRLNILNAYYLPGVDQALLYETITPINTFRLIFSEYFDIDLPLLEDRSYLSSYSTPFSVEEYQNTCAP